MPIPRPAGPGFAGLPGFAPPGFAIPGGSSSGRSGVDSDKDTTASVQGFVASTTVHTLPVTSAGKIGA